MCVALQKKLKTFDGVVIHTRARVHSHQRLRAAVAALRPRAALVGGGGMSVSSLPSSSFALVPSSSALPSSSSGKLSHALCHRNRVSHNNMKSPPINIIVVGTECIGTTLRTTHKLNNRNNERILTLVWRHSTCHRALSLCALNTSTHTHAHK
jgi:hypothetical protein